jgi:hypothetical protein
MKKLNNFCKANKSILIIIALIGALIITVLLINEYNLTNSSTTTSKVNQTENEIKLESILSCMEGVGQTQILINEDESGINGVIIVCEGANNIMTRNNILNAVSTALNIEKNIIAIYAMN